MLSTREIVAWITCLMIAAGLLGAVHLVKSDLTADVSPTANPAESAVARATKRAEDALPAAKPAEEAALPAARPEENAVPPAAAHAEDAALPAARLVENDVPPAATIQLGAEAPKIASAADMPAQQQQFLSVISDFAQKYETAPNDMAKDALRRQRALRQQRARAICEILNDLTVINWVGTVKTGADQRRSMLAVSLDKRSTVQTWGKKYRTLIKPRTAVHDVAIQLSPGQTIVFSGRFFRAKGGCIAERSPTLREAMTQPNWILRFSDIKPAEDTIPPAAKPAEDALSAANPAENAVPPAAERTEEAALSASRPAENAASPTAERAEEELPAAKPAENAEPPAAERTKEAALSASRPAENAVPPAVERAEEAALSASRPAENAASPTAERAEEELPAAKPVEEAALSVAKPAENAEPPAATMQLGADLYEEDPKPMGKLYIGSLHWHAEQVAGAAGEPPDLAARADVEIPELKLKVMLSIRPNSDATLPTSPRFEIHWIVPSDFVHQGIKSIPGIVMNGVIPLALSAVKVTDDRFELDLGRLGLDRNLQLLKDRTWFYIPLIYNDGGSALLSIKKDALGQRALSDAHILPGER